MRTTELLERLIAAQENNAQRLAELAAVSEARIDRTNKMVTQLADATSDTLATLRMVTEQYCAQIDKLQGCRDAILEQNKRLLDAHKADQDSLAQLRKDVAADRDRIFQLIDRMAARQGVNITNQTQ